MREGRQIVGILLAATALVASPAEATVRTVTNFGDSPGLPPGQLRTLIAASAPLGDVILIPAGPPIVLTQGELTIDRSLTIQGAGPGRTVLDGNAASRVLRVDGPVSVSLHGLTIRNGSSGGDGGGVTMTGGLRLTRVELVGNRAGGIGGGLHSFGGLLLIGESTVEGNEAGVSGGGLAASGGTVTLVNVTVSNNRAAARGGGLLLAADTIGSLTSGTVAGNRAGGAGGGVFVGGLVVLEDTLIAGNAGVPGPDCSGTVVSLGSNLVEDPGGCAGLLAVSDLTGVEPLLEPLAANGGATRTHALRLGSPALDQGSGACPSTDQRGVLRPQGPRCDIGAFERRVRGGPGGPQSRRRP